MPIIVDPTTGNPASSVSLRTVWLNLAADPADFVSLPTMSGLSIGREAAGEVRVMANGRRRMVKRAGVARQASINVRAADRAVVQWLEEHVGDLVCVRDDRGRKFFGVFFASDVDELSADVRWGDASLTVSEVTHSEEV